MYLNLEHNEERIQGVCIILAESEIYGSKQMANFDQVLSLASKSVHHPKELL